MEKLWNCPPAVEEAKASQKGLHWALEILIFLAVFAVCTFGEVLLSLPVQMGLLLRDPDYQDALENGDILRIDEAVNRVGNSDTNMMISLFVTAAMIGIVFLFCRLIQKRTLSSLGFVRRGFAKEYAKGVCLGFAMFSAAAGICVLTGSLSFSYAPKGFSPAVFLLFTAGYMVQGMAEEVLCRGYFLVSVGRRYPMSAAVLFNSCAFAALHLLNPGISPLAVANLILFGIFASICFIRTENIWLVGAVHSVWNLVQGNVYGGNVSGMKTSCSIFSAAAADGREIFHGGEFGLEGGIAVTVVLLAAILLLLFWKHNNQRESAMEEV